MFLPGLWVEKMSDQPDGTGADLLLRHRVVSNLRRSPCSRCCPLSWWCDRYPWVVVVAIDPTLALTLDEPLLDVEQAAALLNVRPSWVRDATRAQRLPCIRVGRHLRFTRPMLEQWAARHRIENADARLAPRGRRTR